VHTERPVDPAFGESKGTGLANCQNGLRTLLDYNLLKINDLNTWNSRNSGEKIEYHAVGLTDFHLVEQFLTLWLLRHVLLAWIVG
jgi:hypothetical protein